IEEGMTADSSGNYPSDKKPVILQAVTLLSALVSGFKFPGLLNDEMKKGHGRKPIVFAQGLAEPYPLSPEVLPLQIIRIGDLVLTAVPGEITTMAGRRLKESISKILKETGIEYVIPATYANAYSGYITTKEEYDMQHYEGASTHFGPYTLKAYEQEFSKLAKAMKEETPVDPGPEPIDLSDKQTTIQTGVIVDTQPLPWIPFGKVETDVGSQYKPDSTVSAIFWGAHPKNNLKTQKTFLEIQKKEDAKWIPIYNDHDPCTIYRWERDFVANSKVTITWNIPADTKPGQYRLCHYGDFKDFSGKIIPYLGESNGFSVGEQVPTDEIFFNNSYSDKVELWFYHPSSEIFWTWKMENSMRR
ncbi:MAG: neutral/alkaline non-lysosomal ceramidase C-terminal domain-containing protein, partial [Ignavibacteriaceae bacterium]